MLNDIRQKFKEKAKGYDNNAYLGIVTSKADGSLNFINLGAGPCHGAFQKTSLQHSIPSGQSLSYLLSFLMPTVNSAIKGHHKNYQTWLVNESPWSRIFIDKDFDSISEYGHLVDPNHSQDLVISGLIATRFTTENYNQGDAYKNRYEVYKELLEAGCNKSEALLFTHLFGRTSGNLYPMVIAPLNGGHNLFDLAHASQEVYKNFLTGEYKNNQPTFASQKGYISGVYKTFGESSNTKFSTLIRGMTPPSRRGAKSLSVFADFKKRAQKGYEIVDRADLLDIINQIKKEVGL